MKRIVIISGFIAVCFVERGFSLSSAASDGGCPGEHPTATISAPRADTVSGCTSRRNLIAQRTAASCRKTSWLRTSLPTPRFSRGSGCTSLRSIREAISSLCVRSLTSLRAGSLTRVATTTRAPTAFRKSSTSTVPRPVCPLHPRLDGRSLQQAGIDQGGRVAAGRQGADPPLLTAPRRRQHGVELTTLPATTGTRLRRRR